MVQVHHASPFFRRIPNASPSSSGLGHYPFTVDTGVQIPLGTPFQRAEACSSFDLASLLHVAKPHRYGVGAPNSQSRFLFFELSSTDASLNGTGVFRCVQTPKGVCTQRGREHDEAARAIRSDMLRRSGPNAPLADRTKFSAARCRRKRAVRKPSSKPATACSFRRLDGGGNELRAPRLAPRPLPFQRFPMRKLKIIEHVSLDGVIQAGGDTEGGFNYGDWSAPYRTPAGLQMVLGEWGEQFDLVLGRKTYDFWSQFWPQAPSSPMADRLKAATKYIVTHRPESLSWGPVEAVGPNLIEGVRAIKAKSGPDLVVSATT